MFCLNCSPRKHIHSFCFFSIYIFFFFDNSLPATDMLLIPSDSFFPLYWFSWDVGEDWALWSAGFNDNEKHQFYSRLSWKLNVRDVSSFHLECCRLHKDTRKSTHQVTCNSSKWSPCIHICTIPVKIMKSYILEDTSSDDRADL